MTTIHYTAASVNPVGSIIRQSFREAACPAQKAYIERFNRTYRLEVLDANQIQSLDQARAVTEEWLTIYNEQRSHSRCRPTRSRAPQGQAAAGCPSCRNPQ